MTLLTRKSFVNYNSNFAALARKLSTTLLILVSSMNLARADSIPFFLPYPYIDSGKWYISDGWTNGDHQSCEWRKDAISASDNALKLTLSDKGGKVRPIGCAEIRTKAVNGSGVYEARMKSAAGSGLNSAFFTYTGPPNNVHDEIDFEFLGKDPHTVSVGYFADNKAEPGKVVQLGFDASADFHDYAIEWTPLKISWYVDRKLVFETPDGAPIPKTPGNLFFSLWSGSKIEDSWMGPFQYSEPKSAEVAWAAYNSPGEICPFPDSVTCK
jgi:endo-1,3-1,4-beta-glycanase ExoK